MQHRIKVLAILFAGVLSSRLGAQETNAVTVDWMFSDAGEEPTRMPRAAWTSANEVLLLDSRKPKAERTLERVAAESGARKNAVDRAAALASLKALLGPDAPDALRWPDSLDRAGRTALYAFGDDVFVLDLAASRFTRLTSTPEAESVLRISPDGRRATYVRGNDLYVYDIAGRSERRLTRDGSATVLNGTLSWVYWEEVFDRHEGGIWWSDDSSAVAFLRTDESAVSVSTFVDFKPATPRLITQRYPKAGDANPAVKVGIADVASGSVVFLDPAEAPYEYVMGLKWMPDSRRVAVHLTNRAQTRLDLCTLERGSGKLGRILTDTDPSFLYQKELHFLENGKRLLLSSERTGHTHLYRYAEDGALVNAVTKGEWSVRGPGGFYNAPLGSTFVDEPRGLVYFTALEKSSIERSTGSAWTAPGWRG